MRCAIATDRRPNGGALSSPRPGSVRDTRCGHEMREGRRQTGRRSAHAGSRLKANRRIGKVPPDKPAFQPYWGKPAVRLIGGIVETPASFEARLDLCARIVDGVKNELKLVKLDTKLNPAPLPPISRRWRTAPSISNAARPPTISSGRSRSRSPSPISSRQTDSYRRSQQI